MTLTAFVLIFCSILFHATWHFIGKSRKAGLGFFVVFSFSLFLTMLPFLLTSGIRISGFPPHLWGCAAGGAFFAALCNLGIAHAYRNAEISLVYPLTRALPVLFTVTVTTVFGLGSRLGPVTVAGMAVIFSGCLLMPLAARKRIHLSDYLNKGMSGVLLAAFATTGYTIVDSYGIRAMVEYAPDSGRLAGAGTYACIREAMSCTAMLVIAVGGNRKYKFFTVEIFRSPHPYLAGVFAGLAYMLVLAAMGFVSNVCYVQVFRQLSLPVGMLLGIWILKEKATRRKLIGMCLILGGLAVVALG